MSTYLPPASVRIRPDSLGSRKESILKVLTERTPTLTLETASLAVDALNLLYKPKTQKILQIEQRLLQNLLETIVALELVPLSRLKPYQVPCCSYRDYAASVDRFGVVTSIIYVF